VDTAGTSTLLASEVGRCFLLLGVHYFGYSRIHKAVLREWNRVDINGLLTDLSMGLGAVAFGVKGIVLGPLLTGLFQLLLTELTTY